MHKTWKWNYLHTFYIIRQPTSLHWAPFKTYNQQATHTVGVGCTPANPVVNGVGLELNEYPAIIGRDRVGCFTASESSLCGAVHRYAIAVNAKIGLQSN